MQGKFTEQIDDPTGVAYLRLVHLMEYVPYLRVRNPTLDEYPWCPSIWSQTLVSQFESDQQRRNVS